MDSIRDPYRAFMRPWNDREDTVEVRWFFASDDATTLEGESPYRSSYWYDPGDFVPDGAGELPARRYGRDGGGDKVGFLPGAECGAGEVWMAGGYFDGDPHVLTDDEGVSPCCRIVTMRATGGQRQGTVRFARMTARGGQQQYGTAAMGAMHLLIAHGGQRQGGGTMGPPGITTVEAADGAPSWTGVLTLQFDELDGASLSSPSAGVVRLNWSPATATTSGMVSAGPQEIGGPKVFTDALVVNTTAVVGQGLNVGTGVADVGVSVQGVALGTGRTNVTVSGNLHASGLPSYSLALGGPTVAGGSAIYPALVARVGGAPDYVLAVQPVPDAFPARVDVWASRDGEHATGSTYAVPALVCAAGFAVRDYVTGSLTPGASGDDALGTEFVNGLCVAVGTGAAPPAKGGTGLTALPTAGQLLVGAGAGAYVLTATLDCGGW